MSPRSGLELQSHRFRLRTYQNCLVGKELVDWLLTYEKTSTRYKVTILFYLLSFYILSSSFLAGPKQQSALSSECYVHCFHVVSLDGNLCFTLSFSLLGEVPEDLTLYHTIPHLAIPYHTIPYHTIPYHTTPHHTIPYHTIPYHTIPYQYLPRGFNRSRQPANFAAYFPNHRRLLSNIKFLLSPLSFLSHTISHLLNMKYGIKRKRFLCCVHFSGRCISTFLKGHGINDFNARWFSCVVSHVD